jgi:hypothetical protein
VSLANVARASASESIFDRWEADVVRDEYCHDGERVIADHPLAQDPTAQELKRALNVELNALRDAATAR